MKTSTKDANIIKTAETNHLEVIITDDICPHHLFLEFSEEVCEICAKCGA